jgi:hypothetical protein
MADAGLGVNDQGPRLLDAEEIIRAGQRYLQLRIQSALGSPAAGSSIVGAFGGLIANAETPIPDMQIDFPYSINPTYAKTTVANGGTVTQANAQAVLQTSANAAGSAQLESNAAARYTPGQGQVIRFSAAFAAGVAASRQEVGIGDVADGFFFGFNDAAFGIFRRQNSVDTFTTQTAWNGDKFDGTGPSGVTLVPTLGNVYQIRYQWLGYGAIKFYIENPTTGIPALVHTIAYENTVVIPSIFNPSLPLHAKVINTGSATNKTLLVGSMGAYCEGPFNDSGGRFSVNATKAAITTEANVLSLQNKAVFQGKTNRARMHLDSIGQQLLAVAATTAKLRLVLNATLGGAPVFNDVNTASSIAAFDVAGTTVTGGREIRTMPSSGAGSSGTSEDLTALQFRLNPGDVLTFAASAAAAVTAIVAPSWNEEM